MHIGPEQILLKRQQFLIPCVNYFYKNPPQIVRGEMQYLFDHTGKKYLDLFAGVSVMNCGHCNPFIVDRVVEQMKTLQHTTGIYLTEPIATLAENLANVLPQNVDTSFFCMSGSEANEGAMLLARLYTGKTHFIALEGSLHGRTYMTMSATAIPMWRTDEHLSDNVYFISNSKDETSARHSLNELENLLAQNAEHIAAFICEPIQGNGGIITPPENYYEEVMKLLEKHNVLFIADEIQTGFARTGKMFAIEHYGVTPHIISMAKALGNGTPIAAFSAQKHIANALNKPSASTLGGNPVSCAAALAVLDFINQNELVEKARVLGEMLKNELIKLKQNYPFIHEVRGKGLMLGVELKLDGKPLSEETDLVLEHMKDNGVIIGKNGLNRNVLAIQPPLVISEEDVAFAVEKLDLALKAIVK